MRPLLLCRERLTRLLVILDRLDGSCSLRDLRRTFGIYDWEVEQAEVLGWIKISIKKPPVGRSSRVVEKLSETQSAKLPPWRRQIPLELSPRHWRFALELTKVIKGKGPFGFSISTAVQAYQEAFPGAKSKGGAAASASRLMKRPMIQAAKRWFQATDLRTRNEEMPTTVRGIYTRLAELEAESTARWHRRRLLSK